MSVTPRLVPDHECKQGKCASNTTGCWDECNLKRCPVHFVVVPSVAAPLPAAPAPTRATAEQEAEIDAAVKAGRITFAPGWDDPRPAPAPTSCPICPDGKLIAQQTHWCDKCGTVIATTEDCKANVQHMKAAPAPTGAEAFRTHLKRSSEEAASPGWKNPFAPAPTEQAELEAARNAAYPVPDSPHASVMLQAVNDRIAFSKGFRAALAARQAPTQAPEKPRISDSDRLEWMMEKGAHIAWGKDGERCRVFARNEDGDNEPVMGWIPEAWAHCPREAIDAAIAQENAQ